VLGDLFEIAGQYADDQLSAADGNVPLQGY